MRSRHRRIVRAEAALRQWMRPTSPFAQTKNLCPPGRFSLQAQVKEEVKEVKEGLSNGL
jgi:hypothetical protein